MPQQYKIDKVANLKEIFNKNKNYIFTDYRGLSVGKMTELRRSLRKINAKYIVVKNNYINIIAKEKGLPDLKENTFGPTAVAMTNEDSNELIKVLINFSKDSTLKIKGGWADNMLLNAAQLEELSKLPGKNQLLAMLMATMNAPIQNFVYSCNDIIGRFVRVLNNVIEKKKGAG